jgi:hypothetical protein
MGIKEKAQGVFRDAVGRRLRGGRPSAPQAAAGAAIAGGVTTMLVFRLLRQRGDD